MSQESFSKFQVEMLRSNLQEIKVSQKSESSQTYKNHEMVTNQIWAILYIRSAIQKAFNADHDAIRIKSI